jgi:lysophospholipase L1-like esterase
MLKPLLLIVLFLSATAVVAQAVLPPFWSEIQAFKKGDSLRMPPEGAVVFVGSSSFQKWTDVQAYFPNHTIINRGFGGSSFPDVIRYAGDVIFPYKPKQVVVYCGDNDLASNDSITAQTIYSRFVKLFKIIRSRLPQASIVFVSIKPSPARAHLMPKVKTANALIRKFLKGKPRTAYVDVYTPMLQPNGRPRPELFTEDKLHMNSGGYQIWQRQLEPVLLK